MKNPYDILGVTKAAPLDVIKSVYRILCKQYHPDNPDNAGKDPNIFIDINWAYEILSNIESRKIYDETGNFDSNKESNKDAEVYQYIQSYIIEAVITCVDLDKINILNKAKQDFNKLLLDLTINHSTEIRHKEIIINRIEKSLKKFKTKNENNIIVSGLKTKLSDELLYKDEIIKTFELESAKLKRALEILNDYSYEQIYSYGTDCNNLYKALISNSGS